MNTLLIVFAIIVGFLIFGTIVGKIIENNHQDFLNKLTPNARAEYEKKIEEERLAIEEERLAKKRAIEEERLAKERAIFIEINGEINPELICPHCQTKGIVHSKYFSYNKVVKGKFGGILKTNIKINQNTSGTIRYCAHCKSQWII